MACKYAETNNYDACQECSALCKGTMPIEDGTECVLSEEEFQKLLEELGKSKTE